MFNNNLNLDFISSPKIVNFNLNFTSYPNIMAKINSTILHFLFFKLFIKKYT